MVLELTQLHEAYAFCLLPSTGSAHHGLVGAELTVAMPLGDN